MPIDESVLFDSEKYVLQLRSLYTASGYCRYRMSKFEEYDLYMKHKDFLLSDSVLTFTDTNGRLMALKPDVTLSIIKNSEDRPDETTRLCYNESVYRVDRGSGSFGESMQCGLECFGKVPRPAKKAATPGPRPSFPPCSAPDVRSPRPPKSYAGSAARALQGSPGYSRRADTPTG